MKTGGGLSGKHHKLSDRYFPPPVERSLIWNARASRWSKRHHKHVGLDGNMCHPDFNVWRLTRLLEALETPRIRASLWRFGAWALWRFAKKCRAFAHKTRVSNICAPCGNPGGKPGLTSVCLTQFTNQGIVSGGTGGKPAGKPKGVS